jgi:hypothetical protein
VRRRGGWLYREEEEAALEAEPLVDGGAPGAAAAEGDEARMPGAKRVGPGQGALGMTSRTAIPWSMAAGTQPSGLD